MTFDAIARPSRRGFLSAGAALLALPWVARRSLAAPARPAVPETAW